MISNLDVWAIQTLPQELYTALSNIKTDNDIILYTNVKSCLHIGSQTIDNRRFDCVLYSEENDLLIMLMKDGKVSSVDIINYLTNNNLKFNEITFCVDNTIYHNDYNIKEIWFVRDRNVLIDALQDSVKRKSKFGIYYPILPGYLNLGYIRSSTSNVQPYCKKQILAVDKRVFKGVIDLEDKYIIFITNHMMNLSKQDIEILFKEYNINLEINYTEEPDITNHYKQKILKMTF